MPVKFEVLGVPVGKGRPKFSTVNGHAVAYTPAKTANYETLVRLSYQQQIGCFMFEKDKPLRAIIRAFFPIPKSTSKKKREQMRDLRILHTKKPDADNIIKAVLDALNGVAYYDDSQVAEVMISKAYAEQPKVMIELYEVDRMNEKEEQAYNKAIENLGINPAYQSLIIARLQMEIDDICEELASLFGCPCNFSPPDEIMLDSEYCEDCCGTLQDVECWKRYFYVIRGKEK